MMARSSQVNKRAEKAKQLQAGNEMERQEHRQSL